MNPPEPFLIKYACFLARTLPLSSIQGYLNAVQKLHNWCGLSFDVSAYSCPKLHVVLAGIGQEGIPSKVSKKAPFGARDLLSLRAFCFQFDSSSKQRSVWTAVIVCFWGCLRSDNVVPKANKLFDPRRQICSTNLHRVPEGLLVLLQRTKTRSADVRFLLPYLHGLVDLCPVRAINSLMGCIPSPTGGPLFVYRKSASVVPLLYKDIRSVIRSWARVMGFSITKFGTQSARRGSATTAHQAGVDDIGIMKLGDWLSNTFLSYIDQNFSELKSIQRQMLNQLEKSVL